jgi:tetratricopeptide (TPR) repeat protein
MPHHMTRIWVFISAFLLLSGCAATNYYSIGKAHLEKEEYDAAIQAFDEAKKANPGDSAVPREMGIAYYRKTEFKKAIPLLLEAFIKDTTDGRALFYLGTAYEILKDYPHAMDIYRRYVDVGPAQEIRSCIEARLGGLIRKQIEAEARAALARESSINASAFPDNSVAVLYFKNMGKKRELDPVQKGLADMLITDLSKARALKVVERVRMQKMIDETGLGQTGIVDGTSSPRIGRLVGASRLIQGSFLELPKEAVRMDAGFVQVKPGKALQPQKIQGKMAKFFQLEKDLVFALLDRMAVPLSQAEKDAIRIVPTENLLAFLAYCRGLDAEDRGRFQDARREYQNAVQLDPGFKQAGEASARAEDLSASTTDVKKLDARFFGSAPPPSGSNTVKRAAVPATRSRTSDNILNDQMLHAAGVLDQGFLPGIDSRKPSQEQSQSSFGNSAGFDVRVPVPPGE